MYLVEEAEHWLVVTYPRYTISGLNLPVTRIGCQILVS